MPRMLTILMLPLLAAASLTAAASAEPGSFLRTGPYELITGATQDSWCESGDDAGVLAEPADLRGAHFSFSLGCLFRGPEIPAHLEWTYEGLEHVPSAAHGVEFLLAQVGFPPKYNAEYTPTPSFLTTWIQVGDHRIDLETQPTGSRFYILSAPVDEEAVLWVEDAGRAQGVDLRTGAQVDSVPAYYNGLDLSTVDFGGFDTEKMDVSSGRARGWIQCDTSYAEATRSVWRADLGWAPEGTVYLEVRTQWCVRLDNFTWELDEESALTIEGDGPLSWEATKSESNGAWDNLEAVFTVPADAAEVTIVFTPRGKVRLQQDGAIVLVDDLPRFEWAAAF